MSTSEYLEIEPEASITAHLDRVFGEQPFTHSRESYDALGQLAANNVGFEIFLRRNPLEMRHHLADFFTPKNTMIDKLLFRSSHRMNRTFPIVSDLEFAEREARFWRQSKDAGRKCLITLREERPKGDLFVGDNDFYFDGQPRVFIDLTYGHNHLDPSLAWFDYRANIGKLITMNHANHQDPHIRDDRLGEWFPELLFDEPHMALTGLLRSDDIIRLTEVES